MWSPRKQGIINQAVEDLLQKLLDQDDRSGHIRLSSSTPSSFPSFGSTPDSLKVREYDLAIDVVQSVIRASQGHLARLRRQRNGLLSLNQLPVEILQHIFEECLPPRIYDRVAFSTLRYYQQLCRLREVAWLWTNVIDAAPSLWSYTSSLDSPALTKLVLHKSKYALLDVEYTYLPRYPGHELVNQEYIALMTSVAHRWRSLQIHTSRRDVMEVFLQTRAPEMRSLKAIAGPSHPRFDASHTELFGEIAHRLVDVDINSVSIAWGSASLTGLRSLKLLYLAGPTTAELLNVLANSPDLEELEIRDCDLQPVGEREEVVIGGKRVGIGNVEVHLPRLGSLALRGTPSEQAMIQLLEPLVIPPEAQMSVCAVRIVPRGSQLWDCLGKHMSSMDEASGPGSIMFSHDGRWAQLNYGHGLCTMSGDRPVSRFPIERLTDEPYEIWRVLRFASPVRCEMPTTLHLNRVSSDALAPFMRYVHQTIPGITELLVETMLKPVIDMLKQPVYTSRDRVPEWLYPRLTTLIVMLDPWDRDGILRLADLLRYRVEHARLFGVPAVIGTLRLVSSSVKLLPRVLEELQKVVRNVDTTAIEVGEQS